MKKEYNWGCFVSLGIYIAIFLGAVLVSIIDDWQQTSVIYFFILAMGLMMYFIGRMQP